jgi:uncharacterized protein YoxC
MVIEICMVFIAVSLMVLVGFLIVSALQVRKSFEDLETDLHRVCTETACLMSSMNEFVKRDLHSTSQETARLLGKMSDLATNVQSFEFLFRPLRQMASMTGTETAVPQGSSALKWATTTFFIAKTAKELVKRYVKRKK